MEHHCWIVQLVEDLAAHAEEQNLGRTAQRLKIVAEAYAAEANLNTIERGSMLCDLVPEIQPMPDETSPQNRIFQQQS